MAFCSKCGHQLADGAKFCFECGTKVEMADVQGKTVKTVPEAEQQSTYTGRKQEYAGKIIKCPACGAELPSFTAICPDCGHEINSQNVSPYIREFSKSIDEYDRAIANDPEPPKTGWKTWSKNKRIIWVILNIFTSFIPWVIYLAFPLVKPFIFRKSVPVLSTSEKQKAALIENATFPNEREATIEAMMFTKSKMAFLASEKFNKKTQYWTNLWNTKAEQLNQRAGIILKGDKVVEVTYADIVSCKNKVDKHVQMRAIIGAVIIIAYLVFIAVSGSLLGGISNIFSGIGLPSIGSSQNDKDNFEWLETGLSTKIPRIDAKKGTIYTNSDTELWMVLDDISYTQFEKYVTSCKDFGYSIDAEKDTHTYKAYNAEGYYLELSCWTDSLDITLKAPLTGEASFTWPEHSFAAMIPELVGESGKVETSSEEKLKIWKFGVAETDFNAYIVDCENRGFSIDTKKTNISFSGFNSDGYKLTVSLGDMKQVSITIDAPMQFTNIAWPTTGPATLLPDPPSSVGKISSDYDWTFSVYISGMTIDDFDAYVDKCISKGFEKEYRYETSFSASKGDDIDLSITYNGFDTVYISITNYDEF